MNSAEYLTYEEYMELNTSDKPVSEEDFERLERAARGKLDLLTNYFYNFHGLEEDLPFRKKLFKDAMVAMINYFVYTGGTSSYQTSDATSVTIGRTTISKGNNSSANNSSKNLEYPKEVLQLLGLGGFLYRGVNTSCL